MSMSRRDYLTASMMGAAAAALGTRASAQSGSAALPTSNSKIKVQVALFDGFEVTDALAPYDALKISEKAAAQIPGVTTTFSTTLVTLNGESEVVALDDVRVKPNAAWDESADILLLPGAPALWRAGVQPKGVDERVRAWVAAGKTLATVCTGGVLAARAGVLKGRNANTHRAAHQVLKDLGVNLITARVVDDGDLISAGGVTSGIDLALHLIERYAGPALAIRVEEIFEYERRGTVWRKP